MADNGPEEPLTGLGQGAAAARELFITLRHAGFTEMQALYLTAQILINQKPTGELPDED